MKQQNILLCIIFSGIVHSAVCVSANAEPRKDCELALDSLGYNLNSHAFEEAGWLSKEKHIFNGTLICHINKKKEIHSIEDDSIVIVKDGFFGKAALAKRKVLNVNRKEAIEEEKTKVEEEKRKIDERYEEVKRIINDKFDREIEKVKLDSEPPKTAAAREARKNQIEAARRAENEKIEEEKAQAEETRRRAEAISRQVRQTEVDQIKRRTGSTVSLDISGSSERGCADLLAGHIENIDVHFVKSKSIWGGKYTVWYRDRHKKYSADQYNTRKCQVGDGSVKILSVFQNWD